LWCEEANSVGIDLTQYPVDSEVNQRIAHLWSQAEDAVQSGDLARAQRYLRWILHVCPEDEEAWLWRARLVADPRERLFCLQKAYGHCPESRRIQTALRQARAQQLEASVGNLRPKAGILHCLPDERQLAPPPPPAVAVLRDEEGGFSSLADGSSADNRSRPARAADSMPTWLTTLLPFVF
jgi:hypothetical protein